MKLNKAVITEKNDIKQHQDGLTLASESNQLQPNDLVCSNLHKSFRKLGYYNIFKVNQGDLTILNHLTNISFSPARGHDLIFFRHPDPQERLSSQHPRHQHGLMITGQSSRECFVVVTFLAVWPFVTFPHILLHHGLLGNVQCLVQDTEIIYSTLLKSPYADEAARH